MTSIIILEGRLHNLVHCHVYPLKEVCSVGDAEISHRYHHDRYELDFEDHRELKDRDWLKIHQITVNCPLKKLIEDI